MGLAVTGKNDVFGRRGLGNVELSAVPVRQVFRFAIKVTKKRRNCEYDGLTRGLVRPAQGRHLAVLRWGRENGWVLSARTRARAAESGHLEVLQ